MRWPAIFFKAGKRREESTSKTPADIASKSNSAPATTALMKPVTALPKADDEIKPHKEKSAGGPALRPAVHATKPPVVLATTPTVTPIPAENDPLKAFARANSIRLAKRADQEAASNESVSPSPGESVAANSPKPEPTIQSKPETLTETAASAAASTTAEAPAKSETPAATSDAPAADSSVSPNPDSPSTTLGSATGVRRKKLTDLARIIPPTESAEAGPSPEQPSAVSPPAFTVAVPVGKVTQTETSPLSSEKTGDEVKPAATIETKPAESAPIAGPETNAPVEFAPTNPEPEKKPDAPVAEKAPVNPEPKISGPAPIPLAEAPAPKPETPTASVPPEQLPAKASEKKEFLLVNGERILGNVLSETVDMIYLDHGTLGVLTLPRSQIASRPVEIILINGDRIVGDIMAETPEALYVRHASLGMLTVPRSQRSTRVVEAILKDGDRIIGEVLTETENFTVIRSATLGTVPVPHNKVAMLNRKVEQVTLKALPNTSAIDDKKA